MLGICHAVENAFGNRHRLDATNTNTRKIGNRRERIDNFDNCFVFKMISANVHAREHEFPNATRHQRFCLGDNIVKLAGTRSAARFWNQTITAKKIATVLNF